MGWLLSWRQVIFSLKELFVLFYRWFSNNEEIYDSLCCLFLHDELSREVEVNGAVDNEPGQNTKERLYYCIYCIALLVNNTNQ